MNYAVFGKPIERKFIADNGSDYLFLPTQNPIIYLFNYAPSMDQAELGTGAVETVTTWTQNPGSAELSYSFSAVDDPDSKSAMIEREYWEAIRFVLYTGEQVQTKLRMFTIHRTDGLESIPGVTAEDISSIWPSVTSYITDVQLANFLPLAESEMRTEIGREKWARLTGLADAKMCLAYKAIEMMAASQVVKGNADKFIWMVDYFKDKYSSTSAKLKLLIDNTGSGRPDAEITVSQPVVFSAR